MTCLKSSMNSSWVMIRFIQSCINVKASVLIYSLGSFCWSAMLLQIFQCNRRKTFKLNPVSPQIHEDALEEIVWKVLLLTGVNIVSEDLHGYYCIKRSRKVMLKLKCRKQKQSLICKCRNLGTKSQELTNLKFLENFFFSKSKPHGNQWLAD